MTKSVSLLPSYNWLTEPELIFDPVNHDLTSIHPIKGLVEWGPYSKNIMSQVFRPLRIAFIVANGQTQSANQILGELKREAFPKERKNYLVPYPGFSNAFRVEVGAAKKGCHAELPSSLDDSISSSNSPHSVLADGLTGALTKLSAMRDEFDIVIIVLPERWETAFRSTDGFDLHDYLKAVSATRGIPLQLALENRLFKYRCRCSVMWRLSTALYCKAGGIPWKIAGTDTDTAFVGLSYALRGNAEENRFVTCCSQVFDADGTGLEFVAFDVDDIDFVERDNPFLARAEMRRVMSRTLALYQRRRAGATPKRLVVHKTTHFTTAEVDGCFDACMAIDDVELIQVQQDSSWRAAQVNAPTGGSKKGHPAQYPCKRGSFLQIDGRATLLWTQGNVPMSGGKDFFKEGKGIPSPVLLQRWAGHGSFDRVCSEILGLTKMNWNNDGLYDRLPVTMSYASVLARTICRMPNLDNRPYQFRFFM